MTESCIYRQSGQAMTEFAISVSFIFLGLFVIIPMFGKLMDIQYQNQQAARYVAWERTVWFEPTEAETHGKVVSGLYWESVATRTDEQIGNTMENRFFYGSVPRKLLPITGDDAVGINEELNPIWNYVQSKETMYRGSTIGTFDEADTGSIETETSPGVIFDVIGFINDTMEPFRDAIRPFIGGADGLLFVDHGTDNFYKPVVTTQLMNTNSHGGGSGVWDRTGTPATWGKGIEDVIFSNWDGALKARSAIVADGWNVQSLDQYENTADNYVPSTVFDNAIFDTVIDIASILEGGPSNSAVNKLEFGAVGIEPMPAKPESEGGGPMDISEAGPNGGFYFYDE